MNKLLLKFLPIIDLVIVPVILVSTLPMRLYRRLGPQRLPKSTTLLKNIGVFPIRDDFYEPLFNDAHLTKPLQDIRNLPGIDLNYEKQIGFLKKLNFQNDFDEFLQSQAGLSKELQFTFKNGFFESGDAEFLYSVVRYTKPRSVIEIGAGASTKLIAAALEKNKSETNLAAKYTCIDPLVQPWLENFPSITLKRQKVEDIDIDFFQSLGEGDLLFIDSSHMIRPQGDVLYEYLEVIPNLKKGVLVHVHDIFTPHDYPEEWVRKNIRFWNEQYLLEATLSNNTSYEIIAALNYLKHRNFEALHRVCPYMTRDREPGSFYFIVK
ncbi:MAG: class I SAM-dependent methyltransferase [Gammaproteobacteria bacterium]|nr:class I SAM-dependent methyltransferase [Gammaproteobacteria bacterium]